MFTGKVYGIEEMLKKLDAAEAKIVKKFHQGITLASLATESHIIKDYNRAKTGKGFTDRTGNLRRSVGSKVVFVSTNIMIGYVFAGGAFAPYAVYVEFRWGGKYAYLWPAMMDMRSQIWQIIKKETREAFK